MPKLAQEYLILNTQDKTEARKLIGFDVIRLPAFCELDGKKIPIPKEAIFRKEGLVHYETLSPEYGLIRHVDAFDALDRALETHKHDLVRVTLENNGAEMTACFRLATKLSYVQPELTLVNSYNCATSLSLKLGTYHESLAISALISGGKSRWMHLGNKPGPEKFAAAIEEALKHFGSTFVIYQKMWAALMGERAVAMVAVAIEEEIVPKKMGRQILGLVAHEETTTLWRLYNQFLWPVNHRYEGTPSHRLLIQKNIAEAFSDGGFELFKRGGNIKAKTLRFWIDQIQSKK